MRNFDLWPDLKNTTKCPRKNAFCCSWNLCMFIKESGPCFTVESEWIESWKTGRRFDWQICGLSSSARVSSTVCRRLHFICFHSLMACRRQVSHISFCHWVFLSVFFLPCRFFSSPSRRRKRALATLRPQSHLRQMKQPLSFSSSLLPPISPLLFHPPPPLS